MSPHHFICILTKTGYLLRFRLVACLPVTSTAAMTGARTLVLLSTCMSKYTYAYIYIYMGSTTIPPDITPRTLPPAITPGHYPRTLPPRILPPLTLPPGYYPPACIHICKYVYTYVCVYTRMYICMHVCMP